MTNNLYIPLKNRSVIQISGEDSQKFLQGLVTNDVNKVAENNVIYALMLTPQGKFLYDFFIAKKEGEFLLDCSREKSPEIIKKLNMYKLRSRVKIEDVSNKYEVVALLGDKVFEVINNNESHVKQFCKGVAYIDPRSKDMYARSFIEIDNHYQSFEAFDFHEGVFSDYEYSRINSCMPEGGIDLQYGKSFPHNFGMNDLQAIDYKKGCYVGQEVTARVQHKGSVRKKLYVVESIDSLSLPDFGADILVGNEKVGTLLSSAKSTALAMLVRELVEQNNFSCSVNDIKLKVRNSG